MQAMEQLVPVSSSNFWKLTMYIYWKTFQLVGVMLLVQAVYNVQTQLALVPAILVIKKPNVILFVVVIQLDQAA